MTRRRGFGLQGWLVGALLAVGMAASLAVLLVVLPTLESSVRDDRAKRDGEDLLRELSALSVKPGLSALAPEASAREFALRVRDELQAEVRVHFQSNDLGRSVVITAPEGATLVPQIDGRVAPSRYALVDDGGAVAASVLLPAPGGSSVTVVRRVTGLAPELAIVRRRVLLAMIAVLGLAALAGIAIARVLGGRIQRLATTAATLAGGDLSARYPRGRIAPQEIVTLGESLNGMAGRLQDLVSEITSERDRDRAMIGSLAEGVIAVAPDGTVAVANDAANRLLGLPEEAESARLDALPTAILDAVLAARAPGAPPTQGRLVVLPEGIELELHVAPLADDHGAGTVITLRDVTQQRQLERARRDLVANVSHELKTPIAALKGFLELLEDGVDEPTRQAFLASMTQETGRLERLVEEQLQLARLDAGALPTGSPGGRSRRAGGGGRRAARPPRRARRPQPHGQHLHARARHRRGRPRPHRADPPDPPRQRPAPHPAWRAGGGRRRARRPGRHPVGQRHRRGHPRRGPALHLRPLLPRRPLAGGAQRRSRPRDRSRAGGGPPRQHLPAIAARAGQHLHAAPTAHDRRPGRGGVAGPRSFGYRFPGISGRVAFPA